ncbi:MAG: ribonuclease PH [Verrucomicrobiae bacterium]|nr:ribonuclease PH [Verrucomicrobiae bacterium]
MIRHDKRRPNQLRPIRFHKDYARNATGSVLIEQGNTHVICAVTVEETVPRWMKEQKVSGGWITAEYSMLPYSTAERKQRDSTRGKIDGRSTEIQRLIGRSLRAAVDLEKVGQRTIWVDCDVLQADGGTRTASITGAYVALALAMKRLVNTKKIAANPLRTPIAAISVGVVDGVPCLDLNYEEDVKASVDMNVVMTAAGEFIEVQGTGEEATFSRKQLDQLLALASRGIRELVGVQKRALNSKL